MSEHHHIEPCLLSCKVPELGGGAMRKGTEVKNVQQSDNWTEFAYASPSDAGLDPLPPGPLFSTYKTYINSTK